jgi:hypothetical protein
MRLRHRWSVVVAIAVALVVSAAPGPAFAAGWSPWTYLGPNPGTTAPTISARSGGQLDLFTSDQFNVYHRAWNRDDGWGGWVNLGGPPGVHDSQYRLTAVAAVGRPDYKISIAVYLKGFIWHRAWSSPGGWGAWENIGHPPAAADSAPAISTRPTGDVDIWVVDNNRAIGHRIWSPGIGWRSWETIAGPDRFVQTGVTAVGHPNGSQVLFAVASGDNVFERVWRPDVGWSGWTNLGKAGSSAYPGVGAAARPNGYVDLFARNPDNGQVYHRYRNNSGVWSGWGSIEGANVDTAPSAAARPNGALDVVVAIRGGSIWHRAYG